MNKKLISVDFDETLSRVDVQEYVRQLICDNVDVWVITSRYDDLHLHMYTDVENPSNNDLWEVVDGLGIPREKVRFTNLTFKAKYLEETKIIWHLDDNFYELSEIKYNQKVKTIGIQVNSGSWKQKCQRILKNTKNG